MSTAARYDEPATVVSARAYAFILSSRRLQRKLLPEGLARSPYEILDYDVTLTLRDREGIRATFRRRQEVAFLQNRVSGMLDHMWGHGVLITQYHTDAGDLEDSILDEGRRHVVVGFKRPMGVGERLAFHVERTAMVGFTKGQEWTATTLDHPTRRLRSQIVFPKARPVLQATLSFEGRERSLPVLWRKDGRSVIRFAVDRPRAYTAYTVHWSW